MKKAFLFSSPLFPTCQVKTILIMKLTAFFILATALQVSAKSYSQEKVTVNFEKTRLDKALKEVEKKSSFRFVYSNKLLTDQNKVTLQAKDIRVEDLVEKLLKNTGLSFSIMDNNLVVIKQVVKGRVTDSLGNPIQGVTVKIVGKNIGTATDAKGEFSLNASNNDKLEFSYVGYETQTINVDGKTEITVAMIPSLNRLNDVVVIGYGTQKRKYVTGSVASISGSDLQGIPICNVTNALAGRLPGVVISSPSGLPGVGSSVQVHGLTSYSGQDVLYVIDGVIRSKNDFDLINPSDIESITVLKDAAASVYGVRGGNGVLLITTKRGKASGPAKFSLSGSLSGSQPTMVPERLTSYQDALYRNQYYTNQLVPAGDPRYYSDDEIAFYKSGKINTDLFKLMSKNPMTQQINLSMSGGSEKVRYYVSAGFQNESGLFNKINAKRYTILSNLDFKLSRDLSMSMNLQGNFKPVERP
jgi:TonB-linked SusC/RagA family outer membrane protein